MHLTVPCICNNRTMWFVGFGTKDGSPGAGPTCWARDEETEQEQETTSGCLLNKSLSWTAAWAPGARLHSAKVCKVPVQMSASIKESCLSPEVQYSLHNVELQQLAVPRPSGLD